MPTFPVYDVAIQDGDDERQVKVIALNEDNCRKHVEAQGITLYIPTEDGEVELTEDVIDQFAGPNQLTKLNDGSGLWQPTG